MIKRAVAQLVGYKSFAPFGISPEEWTTWRDKQTIDLGGLSSSKLDDLEALFERFKKSRGVGVLLKDVHTWKAILAEPGDAATRRARTVRQFKTLLEQYLLPTVGHRIYKRHAEGAMLCYYATEITYHPPEGHSDRRTPASVEMGLTYEEIGAKHSTSVHFYANDIRGVAVAKALAEKGYAPENEELRADYLETITRYMRVAGEVGHQYWGAGIAYDMNRSYRSSTTSLNRPDGERGRVVVDVFREPNEEERGSRSDYVNLHPYFWPGIAGKSVYDPETDEDAGEGDLALERENIEVPIHPWVVVFDLYKHHRVRVHVDQLEEYIYDENLSEKLVLPSDQKALVQLLIETRGGMFQDIVRDKGGGAVILLVGPPGTGKTLTAEVYAESEKRALYSVQCSQLGVKPDQLEEELMAVFERARRWNAVLLLDEADVYVHERGSSMDQNAIVGVFLRVLEYQGSTMFLTTNRPEDVDDAIASRCIARLVYIPPAPEDAKRIWRVLADGAGLVMHDEVVGKVVADNPGMTGRDIKNVLKLASLMSGAGGGITAKQVAYVQQFKPTGLADCTTRR